MLSERDPQLLHPGAKCVRVHAEQLARPAMAVDLAAGHAQDPSDVVAPATGTHTLEAHYRSLGGGR
ncbi:MAG: hypothetical protein K8R59_18875 [Thermoanaerobaculales bacterium]|nr:hypothetical protein [Thermoanaerobaculales bacterium]